MEKYIRSTEALALLKKRGIDITLPTLIAWANKFEFSKKIGGTWFYDEYKLLEFLKDGQKKKK